MEDLLPDFLLETHESLVQLDAQVIRLERDLNDTSILATIFRHVHTIKGTCGFLGLSRLEKLAHATENVLDQHRNGILPVTAGSIRLVLRALDGIRAIVDGIKSTGLEPKGTDAVLIAELTAGAETGLPIIERPTDVNNDDTPLAAVLATAPSQILIPSVAEVATILPPEPVAQTIRVSIKILESLMALVSELVLTRNQLLQVARAHENDLFAGPLERLSHITSDLQQGITKTRMQPISNAWSNLPRLVRDLANELGKKIELVMLGGNTELDRQIVELIKDPLIHMVRNSADHGIENANDRRAAGKPEQGHLRLNAYHEAGYVVIEVGDDGRGLPVDRIKTKIISSRFATETELAEMSDQQVQSFIFRAGFSTAAAVTAVSGRGVGMDVVKTNIEQINGTINVTSESGKGTLFTVKIPLTLAIVSALIVEVRGDRFAIPQISVLELVRAHTNGMDDLVAGKRTSERVIEQINKMPVLRLRDHLLPLVDLGDLLKLDDANGREAAADGCYVVVIQVGACKFGLIVDQVFDTEEIVVKPVAPIIRQITVFGGNTILGDGSVIMILDPSGIARATGIGTGLGGANAKRVAVEQTSKQKISLLLIKAGDEYKAVPLDLVSRLESIKPETIEYPGGQPMTQYRGKLMPLVAISAPNLNELSSDAQPVLVFADGNRVMGLMVDEIVDVVEDWLHVELSTDQPGFLGTAIVKGRATNILDTGYWLHRAFKDWFGGPAAHRSQPPQVLVVEDSQFFRSLIIPALAAQGYHVTAVDSPVAALEMRGVGRTFDVILSDIEMPEMDGIEFVREIRAQGAWTKLPVIALTSLNSPKAVEQGRQAGFDDYISKFDKTVLLEAVNKALSFEREVYVPEKASAQQGTQS